jgi:hypothetical protein
MRILYVGQNEEKSTCHARLCALRELGHELRPLDLEPPYTWPKARTIWSRIRYRLRIPADLAGINMAIRRACNEQEFDLIWLDKANTVWPATLHYVRSRQPQAKIVGYAVDDMAARHNQSVYFAKGLPQYDIFFTTKTYNVSELQALGAPLVCFTGNAYDPRTHHPVELNSQERDRLGADVGFIGTFERYRADDMLHLSHCGIDVRVFGNGWKHYANRHPRLHIENKPMYLEDYRKAICATKINLCFLRKINRDRQTQRSIEIPACGGFMLAERTDEHLELFEEGREAEFFGSRDELADKVRYYLANADDRRRIAAAGRERCINSGYSFRDRLAQSLQEIETMQLSPSRTPNDRVECMQP